LGVQSAPGTEKDVVYVGGVYIFSGPMTIRSRDHATKWQEGWFTVIVAYNTFRKEPASYLDTQPYKIPFIDPEDFYAYKLELNKPEEGHHGYDHDRT
jgi:hypothetical protein